MTRGQPSLGSVVGPRYIGIKPRPQLNLALTSVIRGSVLLMARSTALHVPGVDSVDSIVRRHIADINECIVPADVTVFASELLQAGLITPVSHTTAIEVTGRSSVEKISALTSEVLSRFSISTLRSTNSELFHKFVGIIERRNINLATTLIKEFCEFISLAG